MLISFIESNIITVTAKLISSRTGGNVYIISK